MLALKSKLKKDKRLSSDPSIQSAISKVFTSHGTQTFWGATAKLESRLLSSKSLAKEVNLVISSLRSALKPSEHGDGDDDASSHSDEARLDNPSAVVNRPVTLEASEDNLGDSEDEPSRSSDSTESGDHFQPSTSTLPEKPHHILDRASHSPLLPDDAPQSPGTESFFLPALSNGFIPGGSDTDWSDGETGTATSIRKNRRGQRARRTWVTVYSSPRPLNHLVSRIWEKKYGKGAKHLQKLEVSGTTHDTRTPKKHFKGPTANPRPRHPDQSKQNSRAQKVDDASKKHTSPTHLRKSGAADDRPLHPSWIAKLRMKEKTSAVIVPSQAKRIKFDD